MESPSQDRRVQRTRDALMHALVELTVEKGYEKVTVQELAERANVGRTTFYAHYRDKNELLEKSIGRLFDHLHEKIDAAQAAPGKLLPVLPLFQHIDENDRLHRAFASIELLHGVFHQQVASAIERRLEQLESEGTTFDVPHPVLAQYYAGALLALVRWWLRKWKPHPPEEMAEMFERTVDASLFGGPGVGHPRA